MTTVLPANRPSRGAIRLFLKREMIDALLSPLPLVHPRAWRIAGRAYRRLGFNAAIVAMNRFPLREAVRLGWLPATARVPSRMHQRTNLG